MNSTRQSPMTHKTKFLKDLEARCNQKQETFKMYVNGKIENSSRAKRFIFPKGMYIPHIEDTKIVNQNIQNIPEKNLKLQKIKEMAEIMEHEQNNLQMRLRKANKSGKSLINHAKDI